MTNSIRTNSQEKALDLEMSRNLNLQELPMSDDSQTQSQLLTDATFSHVNEILANHGIDDFFTDYLMNQQDTSRVQSQSQPFELKYEERIGSQDIILQEPEVTDSQMMACLEDIQPTLKVRKK